MDQMLQKYKKKAITELTDEEKEATYEDPFQPLSSYKELNLNQVPTKEEDIYQPLEQPKYQSPTNIKPKKQQQRSPNTIKMRSQSTATWMKQQEKAFTGWVNAHLSSRGMHVKSLQTDIARVSPLIHLLEVLEKRPIREITKWHKKPRHKFDLLDGMRICLKQIRTRGKKLINIDFDAEELLKAKEIKIYLALVWRIIVNYSIEATTVDEVVDNKKIMFNSPEARLRWWCNKRLADHLQIRNFTNNWSDGQVLVYLMNQALDDSDRISAEDVQDLDTDELLEGVLRLGDQHLHIPQLLDVQQMMETPDKQSIMTYVSLLRTSIEAKEHERSNADRAAVQMKAAFQSLEDKWLERVQLLEDRVERAENGQAEYAEKLQEERVLYQKQTMDYKSKSDKLYDEIESLKSLILDQQHEKDMQLEDSESIQKKQVREIAQLKNQISSLNQQNDELGEQLNVVMNNASANKQGTEQTHQAFKLQLQQLTAKRDQEKQAYEKRIKELEEYMAQQRKKFNDFYEQYKSKLEQSNKAGREYREKCVIVQADTQSLRRRIGELEKLLADKETEIIDMRKREKDMLEQLATQETVFRIQLQELGQFIKQMKKREEIRETQDINAYHDLLKERELQKFKDQQRKRQSHRDLTVQNDEDFILSNVDLVAQEQALAQFRKIRSKTAGNDDEQYYRQKNQPSPPKQKMQHAGSENESPNSNYGKGNGGKQHNKGNGGKSLYEHSTEVMRTRFGKEKVVNTWYYPGSDGSKHEVILRHNTHAGKDGKSKRVIILDGITRYSDKSSERHFIIKCGSDELKLNISIVNNRGFQYQLFINDQQFDNLKSQYNR